MSQSPSPKIATAQNIFDEVRQGFATVAKLATHVRIREDRIAAYAARLPDQPENVLDGDNHYTGTLEDMTAYFLILDSLNFGSGFKSHLAREGLKLKNGSIYFTVSNSLKNYVERQGVPGAHDIAAITPDEVAAVIGLDLNGIYSRRFAGLCVSSLRDLGRAVLDHAQGSFLRYVEDTRPSAETMVRRLIEMPGFNDIHDYKGHRIPFYKRAQHNVTVLNLMFNRLGKPLFDDIDQVTMFADNAVAGVLHAGGLLEYAPALAGKIKRGEEIAAGSEEEIEIRGCEGQVVELLAAAKGTTSTAIDFVLWHRSVEKKKYKDFPAHRTLTCFY